MRTIDYIYRFDPKNPSLKSPPLDTEAARRTLEAGNRMFANWMESCRTHEVQQGEPHFIVPCTYHEAGMNQSVRQIPKQAPFAVFVGCSDARVPTELLFGQGFNDLFVIRVAGNVLGDVCLGSIDFALTALYESVKVIVVLGHIGCGAIAGAVDSYLDPQKFWSASISPMLRSIIQRIFVAVREADNGLKEVWGPNCRDIPGYREALLDSAVCLNAAHSAFDIRHVAEATGRRGIDVLYGAINLYNLQVMMPADRRTPFNPESVRLALAPSDPREFQSLALQIAEIYKPA